MNIKKVELALLERKMEKELERADQTWDWKAAPPVFAIDNWIVVGGKLVTNKDSGYLES